MTCTVFYLDAGPQTGKTTILQGALAAVRAVGGRTLYVVENQEQAYWLAKRRGEPEVVGLHQAEQMLSFAPYSTVVFDCAHRPPKALLDRVAAGLNTRLHPTQVLIAHNP